MVHEPVLRIYKQEQTTNPIALARAHSNPTILPRSQLTCCYKSYPNQLHMSISQIGLLVKLVFKPILTRLQTKHCYPYPRSDSKGYKVWYWKYWWLSDIGFSINCMHKNWERGHILNIGSECGRTIASTCGFQVFLEGRLLATYERIVVYST